MWFPLAFNKVRVLSPEEPKGKQTDSHPGSSRIEQLCGNSARLSVIPCNLHCPRVKPSRYMVSLQ